MTSVRGAARWVVEAASVRWDVHVTSDHITKHKYDPACHWELLHYFYSSIDKDENSWLSVWKPTDIIEVGLLPDLKDYSLSLSSLYDKWVDLEIRNPGNEELETWVPTDMAFLFHRILEEVLRHHRIYRNCLLFFWMNWSPQQYSLLHGLECHRRFDKAVYLTLTQDIFWQSK